MTLKHLALAGIAVLLVESEALAESYKIQSTNPPGQWKFVRVYDPDTGSIVLGKSINGGDSKTVTVSGERVKIESKLPGHTDYQGAFLAPCKYGNTIRT